MSNIYTADQVQLAIEAYDEKAAEELDNFHSGENPVEDEKASLILSRPSTTYAFFYDLLNGSDKNNSFLEIPVLGRVQRVDSTAGNSELQIIFDVAGQFFQVKGYYDSYSDEIDWDTHSVQEVRATQKMITIYEPLG